MNSVLIFSVGILAQLMFSARLLVQWIASERAHKVLSPVLFWQLSMAASFLLCVYGWLRNDFAIISGQMFAYYIYIWNLNAKESWMKIPVVLRWVFLLTPALLAGMCMVDWQDTVHHLFRQENIPPWLIIFGLVGQFTFTLRFLYQWWYSRRAGESLLPINFWIISLTGSVMIISYAIIRRDPVLILGQSTGFIVYLRNIMISVSFSRRESTGKNNTSEL